MSVRVKASTQGNYAAIAAAYRTNGRQLVGLISQAVRTEAVNSIQRGNPRGNLRPGSDTDRASAPGQPPANDDGILANEIAVEIGVTGLNATVESRAEYSDDLEFGTSTIAPRPFMKPAAEEGRADAKRRGRNTIKLGPITNNAPRKRI